MRSDERVVALAEAAGLVVEAPPDAAPVRVSSGDVEIVLSDRSGELTVERVERGVVEGIGLATRSFAAVERYIALDAGRAWRAAGAPRLRVPATSLPEHPGPLPPGMAAAPDGAYTVLTWHDAGAPQAARLSFRSSAYALAWALTAPLEELIDSFQHPDGRPLFAQAPRR